jgi:glucosylceramidase
MSQHQPTRRDLLKLAPAVAAVAQAQTRPSGEIAVRLTTGEKRFSQEPSVKWQPERGAAEAIVLDPSKTYQEVLGFGASFTDAACYTFNTLAPAAREPLFRELFHPSQMGLSACRICIGSSDYATKMYSFDEGDPDPDMLRFSIDHDREYILPMLKQARSVNPGLFLLASPWSPPGWMKPNKSMLGGCMRNSSFAPYAKYFVKFLQAYAEAGVPVNAVTVQNEVDAEQEGRMPACLWAQEQERQFVSDFLGPQLADNKLDTKIWILDHNYDLWGRAIAELDYPAVSRYVDGVAWHGYAGQPSAMTRVHEAHPDKHAYWTEGGPDIREARYQTDWAQWATTFAGILRNWSRAIMGWNLALDEAGKPNIGPFYCGGLVTIDSKSKAVTRSGQYWAFAHYSRAVRRGARRMDSTGSLDRVSHVAFVHPDGAQAAVLTNTGAEKKALLRMAGMGAEITLPNDSVTTLTWGT